MKTGLRVVLFLILALFIICSGILVFNTLFHKNTQERQDYACQLVPEKESFTSFEGERITVKFQIKNLGRASWNSADTHPCLLSYHLLDHEGKITRYENRRFPLPRMVKPDQSFEAAANVIAPLEEGLYILEFDLVREGISWFKDYGSPTAKVALAVKGKKWPEDEIPLVLDYGQYSKFESPLPELNKILKLIRITLHENEVEFQGRTGQVRGFSAGKDYPQIWLRDAATIIPASRYFYDASYLVSWLEEHLAFQREDGSLEDWFDSLGHADKNTTESDQEASAVQAAFQIYKLSGPAWLEKKIKGETIIERLEKALNFILSCRMEKKYGLLMGAHTPDWGDVDIIDSDQKAIYVDKNTHWTVDIYDQSMFYQACLSLAQMLESLKKDDKALVWRQEASSIQKNTDRWLWQEEKGFYRVHLHLDEFRHNFDEDNIFAMGGNTQAILSGLASEEKSSRIIAEALKRQSAYGLSTISGTLLPPYPRHTFKHPMVDDPYEYQNGGQWDWFGGKLIFAMFEHGFSSLAQEKLAEILRKNLANRSLFEWDSREGIGQGNGYFCGSAGSLSKAIFEGYFGIKIRESALNIEPKIGKGSARIHVHLPASNTFVAYAYTFDEIKKKLTLEYNSNLDLAGKVKILYPSLSEVKEEDIKEKLLVQIDGKNVPFRLVRKNEDVFVEVATDFKRHILEIDYFRPRE